MRANNCACDRCGRCCQFLILEATQADARREPRIKAEAERVFDTGGYLLNNTAARPRACLFLKNGNHCEIYATRPTMCRRFRPGCPQCRDVRRGRA